MNRGCTSGPMNLEVSGCLLRAVLLSGTAAGRYFTGTCRLSSSSQFSTTLICIPACSVGLDWTMRNRPSGVTK
jgi:hypothetical protein